MAILNNLIVNGSSRFLNDAYFNILAADTGRFNKLATKVLGNDGETITVHGLMDVQGELHTKSWSNSNIATIDGSFFICPTLKVTETGSTSNGLTITQSGNTWSVQITSSSAVVTNSVYTMDSNGTVTTTGTWTLGSKVAITGEILVNNEWLPLGTLRGIITARSSDLKSVTISNITDGYSSSNNILNTIGVQSNVKHRNIKISLYEWTLSDSSTPTTATTNPIGIYMTALGDGTGQTMIDIYGGQEPSGTTYKGLAKPYVRIGNLSGLSNLLVGGQNPKGWGIYTSNGYFEGTIAARRGYIGNNTKYWTIGTSGTNSTIFSGPTTVSATGTAGTYLGTDGFLNTASSSVYAQITNGILTAKGADITGVIKANTGYIGGTSGWTIAAQQIYSTGKTIGANDSMFLSTKNLAGTVAEQTLTTTAPSWRLTVGSNFGVDNTGKLYASGAKISGTIDATSFSAKYYNGSTLTRQMSLDGNGLKLMDGSGTILSQIDGSASTIGKTSGNNYNINITGTTIDLRYNTNVLNRINSSGMVLYDGYGVLDNNIIAKFSSSGAQIGKSNNSHVEINSTSLQMFATGQTKPYFFISDLRDSDGNITIYDYFLIEPPDNTRATLKYTPIAIVKVEVQGVDVTGDSTIYSQNGNNFTFYDLPNPANNVIITYTTNLGTELYTGYTLGSRPNNSAIGRGSIALGDGVQASGAFSLAEGRLTKALGYCSHAEGSGTTAQGNYSHAEGFGSKASGFSSHAEGGTASGFSSHAEGGTASGDYSHAEGESTASGDYSHAEGYNTIASGFYAHSGGEGAKAIGEDSFSHGNNTIANEPATSAFGVGIETNCGAQTVLGRYNYIDPTIIRFTMMGEQEFIYSGGSSRPSGRIYVKADQYDASNVDTLLTYDIVGVEYYCMFDETFYYDLRYGFRNTFNSFEIKLEKDTYNKLYVGLYVTTSDVEEGYNLSYKGISGLKITLLKSTKAFVIGNGTSNGTRSNALTVDWDGNVEAAGDIIDGYNCSIPYVATIGTTTFAQITTAINAGKMVFAKDNSGFYYSYIHTNSNKHWFFRSQANHIIPTSIFLICNSDDTWDTTGKTRTQTFNLGALYTVGVMTSAGTSLGFSIPTGRILPSGTTISKVTFNCVARAGSSNGTGKYIIKSTSGGSSAQAFDSSTTTKFYNAADQQKSLTSAMWTGKTINGQTNIGIFWDGDVSNTNNYFFAGNSTNNGYCNNQPIAIYLTNINITLTLPA